MPFGVLGGAYDADYIDMLVEEGVAAAYVCGTSSAENGYALPESTAADIAALKAKGVKVVYRDINSSVANSVAAQEAGADVVVISGAGQGGHAPETRIGLASMLDEVRGQVGVPLVASGCIVDGATAAASAALGAQGAWVGKRFIACEESPAADATKQAIVDARAEELLEWRGTVGYVIGTRCAVSEQAVAASNAGASREDLMGIYLPMSNAMREGDVESWPVGADRAVNNITSVKSAAEIVEDIAKGYLG